MGSYRLYEDLYVASVGGKPQLCRLARVGTQVQINGSIGFIDSVNGELINYTYRSGLLEYKGTCVSIAIKSREGLPLVIIKKLINEEGEL